MTDTTNNAHFTSEESAQHLLERLRGNGADPVAIPGARVTSRSFADMTTLRIGAAPAGVVECSSAEAVAQVVSFLDAHTQPLLVVGGGSNLVVGEGDEVSQLVVVLLSAGGGEGGVDKKSAEKEDAEVKSAEGERAEVDVMIDRETGVVRAFAGVEWDQLVAATVEAGLGGLECLSGIPGSVGATPVQNVGAYGAEVAQVLRRVQLYDRTRGELEWVDPSALDLGYRYSNLKFTSRAVVTAVEFQLTTDGLSVPLRYGELARRLGVDADEAAAGNIRRPAADVRQAVLELRAGKGMILDEADHDTWSAGSFFTNPIVTGEEARDAVVAAVREKCGDAEAESMPLYPVKGGGAGAGGVAGAGAAGGAGAGATDAGAAGVGEPQFKFSAAWLIERAGFAKGWHVPGNDRASLSTKHTLALTNRGAATSEDVVELARAVRAGVREAFGVVLEPEPIWVGVSID
ncbi:UDP-N-acetylmuramate dehydrogenase [Corynebacterium macclintockiae]|uniref:UDP-N-acetylmuramate dehydrogenase n=1 Tax=Corynebacterium macclintockiae TaxID=2913501 RepID=UPI00254A5D96|nr:UDP-N-acetylmuramate dehydrogenase [Corynebacterium macclintockiae]MDK8890709.1 UDP-N-acetylmuramate dehydrogenase [Corynebacterium macclintockiae]